ncbi:MAG TPA: nitrilase-related carbon-nitrogen hydrolase, partial [Bryobacteraceae bacterium]
MLINFILCVVSAGLWWLGTGLHPMWWATWIAALPLLVIAKRSKNGWGVLAWVVVAYGLGGLNQWHYLTAQLRIPTVPLLIALIAPGLVLGLAIVLWRAFVLRDSPALAALAYACTWVTFEFALARLSPHSTFGSIAYTQVDYLPILQVVSLAGLAGITFLLFFVPGALATGSVRVIAPALLLLGGAFLWGRERLAYDPQDARTVKVALISSDAFVTSDEAERSLIHDYAERAARLADAGAKLILIPEKIAVIKTIPIEEIDAAFGGAAKHGAMVVVGLERWTSDAKLNEARVYDSNGGVEASYEKHHMLPPIESHLLVGTARVDLPGNEGVEICKDMDFPGLSREYAHDGAALMIVPAWDFHTDGWMHDRMAVVRGVESGFSLVRNAKEGLLTVSDTRGRVTAEQHSDSAQYAELVADAHAAHVSTFYA